MQALTDAVPAALPSRVTALEYAVAPSLARVGHQGAAPTPARALYDVCPALTSGPSLVTNVEEGAQVVVAVGAVVQEGTAASDDAWAVAVSQDRIFVTGSTNGALFGTHQGSTDFFLACFSLAGVRAWALQLGTNTGDYGYGVAANSQGVFVVGDTSGDLFSQGGNLPSNANIFLARYSPTGVRVWSKIIGSAEEDGARGIAVTADALYFVGHTRGSLYDTNINGQADVIYAKYDLMGNEVWGRQLTSSFGEWGRGIAVGSAGMYITGYANGASFGSHGGDIDMFLLYRTLNGDGGWTRQFGTGGENEAEAVAIGDSGDIFVAGATEDVLFPGASGVGKTAFVARYAAATGNPLWGRQFGGNVINGAVALAVGASGVHVTGYHQGTAEALQQGDTSYNAFISHYTLAGELSEKSTYLGLPSGDDGGRGLALAGNQLVVVGDTTNKLTAGTAGSSRDVFVAVLDLDRRAACGA